MMTYRTILPFLLCLVIAACHPHRSVLEDQVQTLANGKTYETAIIGIGFPSTQHQHYEKVREATTRDDLVHLCYHRSPVVNAYAFQALLEQDTAIAGKVYIQMKKMQKYLPARYGCMSYDHEPLESVLEHILFTRYPFDITRVSNDSLEKKNFDIFYGFVRK